jgi:hypothetical protein
METTTPLTPNAEPFESSGLNVEQEPPHSIIDNVKVDDSNNKPKANSKVKPRHHCQPQIHPHMKPRSYIRTLIGNPKCIRPNHYFIRL